MERLHYLVVQLEEAKRFLQQGGGVPHLRIALILLDNAAEMILHRAVSGELRHAERSDRLLKNFPEPPVDDRLRDLEKELRTEAIDAKTRAKIMRSFPGKTRLLVQRSRIPASIARIVNHLHSYRNEAFHSQAVRQESIAPATLVLFDVTCELLLCLQAGWTSFQSDGDLSWLGRYGFHDKWPPSNDRLLPTIVSRLRADLRIDTDVVRTALADHLDARIVEFRAMLDFIVTSAPTGDNHESLLGALQDWAEARRVAMQQAGEPKPKRIGSRRSLADVHRWQAETTALRSIDDRLGMFDRFATIEDEFEPIEKLVLDAAADVEMAIQFEIDRRRGK